MTLKKLEQLFKKIQKGFTIKDRLLRPSLVGVLKEKLPKKEEKTEQKSGKFRR